MIPRVRACIYNAFYHTATCYLVTTSYIALQDELFSYWPRVSNLTKPIQRKNRPDSFEFARLKAKSLPYNGTVFTFRVSHMILLPNSKMCFQIL